MCSLLIPFHVLTGCDSTSAFKGKGKLRALNYSQATQRNISLSQNLENTSELMQLLLSVAKSLCVECISLSLSAVEYLRR